MKLDIELPFEIGQELFYLKKGQKTIYAPCTLCGNTRSLTIEDSATGDKFKVPCPKCSNAQIKGEQSQKLTIFKYKVESTYISELKISSPGSSRRTSLYYSFLVNDSPSGWGKGSLILTESNGFYLSEETLNNMGYYLTRSSALAKSKELNAEAIAEEKEFMKLHPNAVEDRRFPV